MKMPTLHDVDRSLRLFVLRMAGFASLMLIVAGSASAQSIGGNILSLGGVPIPGVTVVATQTTTLQQLTSVTDASGHYVINPVLGFSSSTYAVVPGKSGYVFTPPFTNLNFVAFSSPNYTVDFSTPASVPTAAILGSQPAIIHDPPTAILVGYVNPDGTNTTAYFQYGLTAGYGGVSSNFFVGAGIDTITISNLLSELLPGTNYHVRLVATNQCGVTTGSDNVFSMPTGVPAVNTLSATGLAGSSATLNGSATPNYANTTAWFQWGTTTNYGSVTVPQLLGNGSIGVNFSQLLTNVAGTTYHFRAVASSTFGTNYGADATLTPPLFYDIGAGLPGVYLGNAAWGDYDNDGHLDFFLFGLNSNQTAFKQIWHNTGTAFTVNTLVNLNDYNESGDAWGDYNNDGLLDIATGTGGILQNTGTNFTNALTGLPITYNGSVTWGDYDNDGRPDLLLTGANGGVLWHNTASGFIPVNTGLPIVYFGSATWGDYDGDGRLDILITGAITNASGLFTPITQIWRNTGNGFSNINANLPGVAYGSAQWGDYDNDGRLDILLTGGTNLNVGDGADGYLDPPNFDYSIGQPQGFITQVWRNTGSGFTNINAGLPGIWFGSAAWGDYDNDGRLDILLTGATNTYVLAIPNYGTFNTTNYQTYPTGFVSQVWRNTGSGFSNVNAGLPGVVYGSAAWGDYDNYGRLDILLTGATSIDTNANGLAAISEIWRNNAPITNTPPSAPTGLAVTTSGTSLVFSWNAATDFQTPASGLTYNLRVGTTPGGGDLVGPMADGSSGFRRLPQSGNAEQRLSRTIVGLPPGQAIYWSVQAVDTAFAGSPFAPEKSFAYQTVITPPNGVLVPGDTNGDGIVDQNELAGVLSYLNGNGMVNDSELNLVLSDYFPYSPFLSMTNVAGLGGSNVTFALTNSVAGAFSVEYSTNLADWLYLGPATPRYLFTDTNAPALPQRYYRLRWP
jgi:hypothetical protein